MENENKAADAVDQKNTDTVEKDYIKTIQEIKKNSVERGTYEKLKEEHKRLLQSIVDGQGPAQAPSEEKIDISDLRKKLATKEMTNLEYIDTALKLRKEIIKRGEPDPFLPIGKKVAPTAIDYEKAEQVAAVFEECVEKANGNPTDFTIALKGRIRDDGGRPRGTTSAAGRIIN